MRINLKIALSIFLALAVSRFIPHPPNFTSLIALSFYVPAIFGSRYMPVVLLSFVFTDLVIGFHNTLLFTWGSILLISFISKYFQKTILSRLGGSIVGALIFFVVTNFGVWVTGMYGYNFNGLITTYLLAVPFFANTAISTFIFASLIETGYRITKFKIKNI